MRRAGAPMIASGMIRANERVRLVRELPNLRVDSEGVLRGASASVTGARYVVGLVTRVVTEQDLVVSSARMSHLGPGLRSDMSQVGSESRSKSSRSGPRLGRPRLLRVVSVDRAAPPQHQLRPSSRPALTVASSCNEGHDRLDAIGCLARISERLTVVLALGSTQEGDAASAPSPTKPAPAGASGWEVR
jgi:hypothetical protein